MTDLVERCRIAGHAAAQKLLAEYDADPDRAVSQRECDEVCVRAIIPVVLEAAAKVAANEKAEWDGAGFHVDCVRQACGDIAYRIRALGGNDERG